MWDLSQNDGPTSNVLMHIIIYSTVYEPANVLMHIIIYSTVYKKKKRICIHIDSAGPYIYFGIRAIVKLFEKKGVLHFILVSKLQLNC